jgi:uncharacterized protein YprB with RNaseH-like and TPR domain
MDHRSEERTDTPRDTSIGGRLDNLLTTLGAGPALPSAPPDQLRLMRALRGHVHPTPQGDCYVICDALDLSTRHGDLPLGQVLRTDPTQTAVLAKDAGFQSFDPCTALFFDLETTGLATTMGTLPFLIGAAHLQHGQAILEQWLLRDPDEEAAALTALAERIAEADWLVSFNGRSFDWPLLEARFALHRIDVGTAHLQGHLDLLHAARRLLRHALPNCKLTTLEAQVLGLRRVDDTPGSQVPATYHAYLTGGDPHPLVGVVKHNRDDILSMLTLLGALLDRVENATSWALRDPPSSLAVAQAALALGRLDAAEAIYQVLCGFPTTAAEGEKGLARVGRQRTKAAGWSGTRKR